jgi:hypothetical protein
MIKDGSNRTVRGLGSLTRFVSSGKERDITRPYRLFCYLADHELATQTGKPFAIRDDAIIRGFDQIAVTRYEDAYLTLNVVRFFHFSCVRDSWLTESLP